MRNGMMLFTVFTAFVLAGTDLPGLTAQQSEFKTVTMIGCLAEEDDRWVLTNATEPIETGISPLTDSEKSVADAIAELGEGRFHLIGVAAWDMPAHKDHKAQVKGMLIEATPESRVNLSSLRHMSGTCPEG